MGFFFLKKEHFMWSKPCFQVCVVLSNNVLQHAERRFSKFYKSCHYKAFVWHCTAFPTNEKPLNLLSFTVLKNSLHSYFLRCITPSVAQYSCKGAYKNFFSTKLVNVLDWATHTSFSEMFFPKCNNYRDFSFHIWWWLEQNCAVDTNFGDC